MTVKIKHQYIMLRAFLQLLPGLLCQCLKQEVHTGRSHRHQTLPV
jgi:hypothetical protein